MFEWFAGFGSHWRKVRSAQQDGAVLWFYSVVSSPDAQPGQGYVEGTSRLGDSWGWFPCGCSGGYSGRSGRSEYSGALLDLRSEGRSVICRTTACPVLL